MSPTIIDPVEVVGFLRDLPAFYPRSYSLQSKPEKKSYAISQDGEALALLTEQDENLSYTFKQKPGAKYGELVPVGSFDVDDEDVRYGVSSDGATIAVNQDGSSAIYKLRSKCKAHETMLYLTTNLDLAPDSVSWSVETVFRLNDAAFITHSVIEECMGCYESAHSYDDARVVETICLPRDMVDCVRLRFQFDSYQRSSFMAYFHDEDNVDGDNDIEPFASFDSENLPETFAQDGVFSLSYGPSDSCEKRASRTCEVGASLFLVFTFERQGGGPVAWVVGSQETGLAWRNDTIAPNGVDTQQFEICVPSNECGYFRLKEGTAQGLAYLMAIYNEGEVVGSGKGFGLNDSLALVIAFAKPNYRWQGDQKPIVYGQKGDWWDLQVNRIYDTTHYTCC
eukprot:CAMPEP_0116867074 /NCGR_PEP_ID=MMETSP0418-20121206/26410_1 /TAXON_ID=1158023 /ORGANISM="Astrosyne radiata, Strain 13vi08-1A" /LENGTH=394 /DNA_ID=CAMNT_0004502835 /DNA_START=96 /DNA_END=1281 /DNA_ORIENTATION=+